MSIRTVKLVDVSELNPRYRSGTSASDEEVAFVPMASVSAETASVEVLETRPLSTVLTGFTYFQDGDILVAKITPCFENGKIAMARISQRHGFGSTEFHVIRPKASQLDARYLLHFLRQPRLRIEGERKMTGSAGQRRVPRHFLEGLDIPLPPFLEQQRMADVLDQAEILRAKRRYALAKLDTLTQSLFCDRFGDPRSNPKGWSETTVGEIAPFISSGMTPLGGSSVYQTSGILFIRSQNVLMNGVDFSDVAYVSDDLHRQMKRTWVKNGDVLLNITGASIGRVHYYSGENDTANVNQHVCIIRVDRNQILPAFLSRFLSAPSYQAQIVGQNSGATRQAFNFEQIRRFKIFLPPMELQIEFVRQESLVAELRAKYSASLNKLNTLFASLQHRAFKGEL